MNETSNLALEDTQILNLLNSLISKYAGVRFGIISNQFTTPNKTKRLSKNSSSSILECLSTDSESSSISQYSDIRLRGSITGRSRAPSVVNRSPSVYSIDQY